MGLDGIPKEMLACQVTEVRPTFVSFGHQERFSRLTPIRQFNKPYEIHKVPTPESLGPHDLLIKVAVASLCMSRP